MSVAQAAQDERFMRLAIALGERHLGLTAPNPSVGAVLVAGPPEAPTILAQGITQAGGRPHAERVALDAAGERARGATLYVSLEPCSHHGRTSPCADAIVAAGVGRVVSALEDPDERVRGRGHARLRKAGIAVTTGVLAADAYRAHRGHVTRVTRGRPLLRLKLARTADGCAASAGSDRLMITGAQANAQVHLERAHADAILVGVGTVLADDPDLTVRLPGLAERSPLRVVLDSDLATPVWARLIATTPRVPTLLITTEDADDRAARRLVTAEAEIAPVSTGADRRVDLHAALADLGQSGITRVLCEGGPTLADALARQNLVDEFMLLTGPKRLGDEGGLPAIGPHLAAMLADGRLRRVGEATFGEDRAEFYEAPFTLPGSEAP